MTEAIRDPVPEHVPSARVRDFNVYDFFHGSDGQVHLGYRAASREADEPATFWSPYNGGHWVVTRAAAIGQVISDAERFSNRYVGVPKALNPVRIFRPFQMDPPEHIPFRHLISGALSPRVVETLKRDAKDLTIRLIEGFRARGECDFVSEFAQHMPIGIFMSIVDLPEADRGELLEIAERIARPKGPDDRMGGYAQMDAYIGGLIETRRDAGPDDFVGQLCLAEIEGRRLNHDELMGVLGLVMVAGLDTVSGLLGHVFRFLAENPDHRRDLRENPEIVPGAVEELLRVFASTQLAREVREDVEVDGVTMKKGDMVVAPLVLYNLDETTFDDPLRVDFRRPRKPPHVAFGGPAHRCLGAMLARTELQIVIREWLDRIPEFEVGGDGNLPVATRVTYAITSMTLTWPVP